MKDLITIGLPSKGRLKDKAISFFNDKGFKILQSEKKRNYFGTIANKNNIKIIFLHAKEIIQRLGDGTLDIGVSGLDLLKESNKNLQHKINIQKKLDFGNANLVIAVPDDWIDVQTIADLEEVSFDIRSERNSRLRVATKYPNLTNDFLISKGVTQYKLIPSLGATETYPFIGSIRSRDGLFSEKLFPLFRSNLIPNIGQYFGDMQSVGSISKSKEKSLALFLAL